MIFTPNDPYQIAQILKQKGFPVTSISPNSQDIDGAINLGSKLQIQVGDSYIAICEEHDEDFSFEDIPNEKQLFESLQFRTQTFAMIKPKADKNAIIREIEKREFKIIGTPLTKLLTEAEAMQFYAEHEGRPYFTALVNFMKSEPVTGLILTFLPEPAQTVTKFREAIGATNSSTFGSIRANFGNPAITRENAIHGSDSRENAKHERQIFKL